MENNADHWSIESYKLGWKAFQDGKPDSPAFSEAWREGWGDAEAEWFEANGRR